MSRRSQVVRSDSVGGIGSPRDLGGGCKILCCTIPCVEVEYSDDFVLLGPIVVDVPTSFQRIFVSATVDQVIVVLPDPEPPGGRMDIGIVCSSVTGDIIAAISVPSDDSGCLTGATALPVGQHDIYLRLAISTFGGAGSISGGSMQVIVGQVVDEPDCQAVEVDR